MSRLTLQLLGTPSIERDGRPVEIERRKGVALLCYLAITQQTHSRDALATLLWPEFDQTRARAALRRTLAALNESMGDGYFDATWESIRLNPKSNLCVDVIDFRARLGECHSHPHAMENVCADCINPLTTAVTLYRGDLLSGFTLKDAPEFDNWQLYQTENLRREVLSALDRLVRIYSARREFERAIVYARRSIGMDALNEQAHRNLMLLYAWTGLTGTALKQFVECERILTEQLGARPEEETVRLYESIKANHIPPLPTELLLTAPIIPATRPHNLPIPATAIFGRERELDAIDHLFANPHCRLVTVVGIGGIGKTRLALEAATRLARGFTHGAFFVPLAAIPSPELIITAIAAELQFNFAGRQDFTTQLLDYLQDKESFLLLDNFEHLRDGIDLVAKIIQQAPGVKILVTSRERLLLQSEWIIELEGLRYPPSEEIDQVDRYAAISLFVQVAQQARADFCLTSAETPYLIQICKMVDGNPLAIKLAAGWVSMLSCAEIASNIEKDLSVLSTNLRDLPERHRNLRAVFEHSWNLLNDEERRVARAASAFRGTFDRHAAEQVTNATLPTLLNLIHKSFLHYGREGRFEMHELLRHYAAQKLAENGAEREQVFDRFCDYYFRVLKAREESLRGKKQKEALDEISEEIQNIRAAWDWATQNKKLQRIALAAESLFLFYDMRSWFAEGQAVFERAVRMIRELDSDQTLCHALARQARFCQRMGLYDKARELYEQSIALSKQIGHDHETAFALNHLGDMARQQGKIEEATQLLDASLAISKELEDDLGVARTLNCIGIVEAMKGNYADAKRQYEKSLLLYESVGDQRSAGLVLNNLGNIALLTKDYRKAKELLQASLVIRQEIGEGRGEAMCLDNLAEVALLSGEFAEAKLLLERGLEIRKDIGDRWGIAYAQNKIGEATYALGEFADAKLHFRQALNLSMEIGAVPLALDTLVNMATLLKRDGQSEQAIGLLAFALEHSATGQETKDRAALLLPSLRAQFPKDDPTLREGQTRRLEEVVKQILAD